MHRPLLNRDWIEPAPVSVSPALDALLGSSAPPVVAQILARRGLAEPDVARAFLDPAYYRPASAADLPGMEAAVARLIAAVGKGDLIAVWGDYDVDGQTSTALLVGALRDLGGQVVYHLPVRAREPHGVNVEALAPLLDSGVRLLLTCDTGIASHAAVEYAEARGVPVIVTDHHDLPDSLPRASVVVNPKLLNSAHALAALPGVGVAYKLAEALYAQAARTGGAEAYLDLVALGIVADVADLRGDTRYLLQRGLQVLRTRPRPAVAAMLKLAGLEAAALNEGHIGFSLGPQLNAMGRLADANPVVNFLNTTDPDRAQQMAAELARLNSERRLLTSQVMASALAMLEREPALLDDAAVVLAHPQWPPGILGIVAARLVEQFGKPVLLLTTPEGELARGSARSVPGCDITAALQAQPDLLEQYGGHRQAAGLSIRPEHIGELRRTLSRAVAEQLGEVGGRAPLAVDSYVALEGLTLPLVDGLERLAPFGAGCPIPVLAAQDLTLESRRPVGKSGEHLALVVTDNAGVRKKIMLWNGANRPLPEGRFDLAFTARGTTYREERQVQVEWIEARPARSLTAPEILRPAVKLIDYRRAPDYLERLREVRQPDSSQVWAEAGHRDEIAGIGRRDLGPGPVLVIWTAPPGPDELNAVLARVQPEAVYLVGLDPMMDERQTFLQRLAGVIKYALNHTGGEADWDALASATAQREIVVRAGVDWFVARGRVVILSDTGSELRLALGDGARQSDARLLDRLNDRLAESGAYRSFFRRTTSPGVLFGR